MNDYDDWENGFPITPKPTSTSADQALLNFSINNPDLDKLESIIGTFNPFKVLGIQDFEIRHSNVLAWLLDPAGHHGLGDSLFKNLLLEILRDSRGNDLPQINDIISASFSDLRVMREWRNIDILAMSPANNLVMVIENKINADESKTQLAEYVGTIKKKFRDFKKVFVLLTLDGAIPKGNNLYIPFTHVQIHGIVQSNVELRRDHMPSKVYDFIQQYLQILEEKTMQSAELTELCGKLYREHGAAIKMILDYGKPKLPPKSIQEFHKRTNTESVHAEKDSVNVFYTFIPCVWNSIVPMTNKYASDRYLVFFTFNFSDYENHKIALTLNVGNFRDQEERVRFVEQVAEAATADKDSNLIVRRSSKTNTTVFSKPIPLKDGSGEDFDIGDYDAVTDKLAEVYNSVEVQKALKVLDGVVQKFTFEDTGK